MKKKLTKIVFCDAKAWTSDEMRQKGMRIIASGTGEITIGTKDCGEMGKIGLPLSKSQQN